MIRNRTGYLNHTVSKPILTYDKRNQEYKEKIITANHKRNLSNVHCSMHSFCITLISFIQIVELSQC